MFTEQIMIRRKIRFYELVEIPNFCGSIKLELLPHNIPKGPRVIVLHTDYKTKYFLQFFTSISDWGGLGNYFHLVYASIDFIASY